MCYIFELPKYSLWVLKHFGKNWHDWKEDSAWKTLWCQVYKMKHKPGVVERVSWAPSPRRSWCPPSRGRATPAEGRQPGQGRPRGWILPSPWPSFCLSSTSLGHPGACGPVSLSACQPPQAWPDLWVRCSSTSGLSLEPLRKPRGGLCPPYPSPPVRAPV